MKTKFYCVWVGRVPGVYSNWTDCETQVRGFSGAKYKAFSMKAQAEEIFDMGFDAYMKMVAEYQEDRVLESVSEVPVAASNDCVPSQGREVDLDDSKDDLWDDSDPLF